MNISVVIPSYNRGELIAETLDAIFAQSRVPDEVVVVDDGSTDTSVQVIRERYGNRVKLICQENGGPESARARGLDEATGDWIALCDSDDVWHEDHLMRLCALHDAYPDADCLFTNFREVGNAALHEDKFASMPETFWAETTKDTVGFCLLGGLQLERFLPGNPVFPSTMMFSRALYDAVGGINRAYARTPAGDADLTRRMALMGVMACDWHISVDIAKHGANFSADDLKLHQGKMTMLRDYLAAPTFNGYGGAIRAELQRTAIIAMEAAFNARNMEAFRQAAEDVPFAARPMGLKGRSLLAWMPQMIRTPLLSFYAALSGKNKD